MSARGMDAAARLLPALLALLVAACGPGRVADGGTTDTGNSLDVLAGTVLLPDGAPAAGARVTLRRADYLTPLPVAAKRAWARPGAGSFAFRPDPDEAEARAIDRADSLAGPDGRFALRFLDTAAYRLELRASAGAETLGAVVDLDLRSLEPHPDDSLELDGARARPLARVTGRALLAPGTSEAWVQVYGLERLARVDLATGRFLLRLPAGRFVLRVSAPRCGADSCARTVEAAPSAGDSLDLGDVDLRDPSLPYAAWARSARVEVNTSATGADVAEDVADFPLLVRLEAPAFDFAAARPDGADLRFSRAGGRVPLRYEIERWDPAAGKAEVWVRLDTVHGNDASQHFLVHWGNPAAAGESDGRAVFDTALGYAGVWHLAEAAGTAEAGFRDATAHGNHGTGGGLAEGSRMDGAVGPAQRFDGNDDEIRVPDHNSLDLGTADFTLSAWARADTVRAVHQLLCKRVNPGSDYEIQLRADGTPEARAGAVPSIQILHGQEVFAPGAWRHVVFQRKGSLLALYVDGVRAATGGDSPRDLSNAADLYLGRDFSDAIEERWNGGIDEVRIQRAAPSEAWIRLSHRTQRPGSPAVRVLPLP